MYIRHILSIPILFIYSILFHHPVSPVGAFTRKKKEETEQGKKNCDGRGGGSSNVGHWLTSLERMGGALALGMGERRGAIFSSSIQDGWKKPPQKLFHATL